MSLRHPIPASFAKVARIEALEARRLLAFAAAAVYAVDSYPQAVVTGDVNNDGRLDLVTANASDIQNAVSALLGNANGTFQAAVTSAAGISSDRSLQSLAVGDFNGDGMLDLVTGSYNEYGDGGDGVSMMMGNGDGTFDA